MKAADALVALGQEMADVRRLDCTPTAATLERWAKLHADIVAGVRWVREAKAARASRHAAEWFRVRFPTWEAMGYARLHEGQREYHEAVVPIVMPRVGLAEDPETQARRDAAA